MFIYKREESGFTEISAMIFGQNCVLTEPKTDVKLLRMNNK